MNLVIEDIEVGTGKVAEKVKISLFITRAI